MIAAEDSMNLTRHGRWVIAVALVALLLIGAVGPAVAQSEVSRPAVVFDLQTDGSADLTVVLTYDLTTETERQAFKTVQENSSTKEAIRTRFETRMEQVATATSDRVDRDVSVTETSISVETTDDGETGIVRLTATMTNLAAVEGDQLTLTEPLASGFYTERDVIVRMPDGYEVATVRPEPDSVEGGALTWSAGTEFDGFELVAHPAEDTTDSNESGTEETTATQSPGFGLGVGLFGLVAGWLFGIRRRQS